MSETFPESEPSKEPLILSDNRKKIKSLIIFGSIIILVVLLIILLVFLLKSDSSEEQIKIGHTAQEWRTRAIYQILTDRWARDEDTTTVCSDLSKYCGGNWKSIMNHLDYIKNMGFNAIWISPIVENIEGSYHGYHFKNLYKPNSHFGTEDDLKNLVKECHKRDIWVMTDIVPNHCGPIENNDFSQIVPFNKPEYYHDKCQITDSTNEDQLLNCWIYGLPDLKQENEYVSKTLLEVIKDLIKKYELDGLRAADVTNVPNWFWDKVKEVSGVYELGSVTDSNAVYSAKFQDHFDGISNFPLFNKMREAFKDSGDLRQIETYVTQERIQYPDPKLLAIFVENHDNKRFLNETNDKNHFKNAVVFSMTFEGIPIFYYGGEQYFSGGSDPNNRESFWGHYDENSDMYLMLKKINNFRKKSQYYLGEFSQSYASQNNYCFTRGDKILVALTNSGTSTTISVNLHPFAKADVLCNILEESDCVTVGNDKSISITLNNLPKIYALKSLIEN